VALTRLWITRQLAHSLLIPTLFAWLNLLSMDSKYLLMLG
jgi:hypothetical protein